MIDLSVLTEKASLVAKEAGTYLRKRQRTFDRSVVELKSMNALVSDVDRSTEELIVAKLTEVFPQAGFLTEEETTTQKTDSLYTWVIDPLDGTTNFVHGFRYTA